VSFVVVDLVLALFAVHYSLVSLSPRYFFVEVLLDFSESEYPYLLLRVETVA
tara:strand:- start:342 stop:497 length:156 start_codon:yes stop_codon:yes gene_type:complete